MRKKITSIVVCMLLFVTLSTVTATIEQNQNETGLAKNNVISQIEPVINPIPLLYDPAKAFMAYDPGGTIPQGTIEFNLGTPGSITSLQAWQPGSNGFCTGAAWTTAGKLYMCDYNTASSTLYEIDPITGANTLVGAMGVSVHAMTYDVTTDTMYAAGGAGSATNLYTVNPGSGATTIVGAFGSGGYMLCLACDGAGQMYGIDISTEGFYSVDKTTGAATLIGSTGLSLNYAQDMCYDIDNDICYGALYDITYGGGLYTINVGTGAATSVGGFPNAAEVDAFAIPYATGNQPPATPGAPAGPTTGVTGEEYTFTAVTTDPETDNISYWFDWDDGTNSGWVGPFSSGATATASHSWDDEGSFDITVKAKDENGAESGFSAGHTIVISAVTVEIGPITGGLLKVKSSIINPGTETMTNVDWSITLDGGLILLGKNTTGTITGINAGGNVSISSKLIIGFGATTITVTAGTATKTQDATVILFFIKI